jgi:hypothetical protein
VQRKEGAKEKATEQKNNTEGCRRLIVEQQLGLDNLKCRQKEQAISNKATKLIALNMKASGIHTDIVKLEHWIQVTPST